MALRDRLPGAERERGDGPNLVGEYLNRLLVDLDRDELHGLTDVQRRARLERRLSDIISFDGPVLSARDRAGFIRRVIDEALGLGVLEPLLADETITEIMVNGADSVFVERRGRVERHPTVFSSEEQLMQTIDRIVSKVNRRIDESSPMVDARLESGERVNVIIPPLSLDGPTLTIRRFPRPFRLEELVVRETLSRPVAELLTAVVRAKFNVIISGGTGTGKTTFLNSLSGMIPEHERIITIEDAAELSLQQPHVVRLESRPANVEGSGQVSIRDLVRNSLRMRPDRIVVGEVRGGETLDMLQAMNTGHAGSLATVHANSTIDALGRLETLASMDEMSLPSDVLRDQINTAVDIVIQLSRLHDGSRKVVDVAALVSKRREPFRTVSLAHFQADPAVLGERARGVFLHHHLPEDIAERLHFSGQLVPDAFQDHGGEV
ncbi:MAG: CpaF family protein [Ornithinimicrobium sp.]|uniref:CpaF family protein n=1 Tax=Ornithinimicrobium sp. TaxID=1977084 RepID=UPI0026E109A9|nr:CpaF family protein [Ornithinimicrobium sp.]MDO5740445.1 CpaF family protein [Ornithinimicrobium sp.]